MVKITEATAMASFIPASVVEIETSCFAKPVVRLPALLDVTIVEAWTRIATRMGEKR